MIIGIGDKVVLAKKINEKFADEGLKEHLGKTVTIKQFIGFGMYGEIEVEEFRGYLPRWLIDNRATKELREKTD